MTARPRRAKSTRSPALIAFGSQLKRARNAKSVLQEQLARATNTSVSFVSKVENGRKRCGLDFVRAADELLEADGSLLELWEDLNRDGHPVPLWFDWPEVEGEAVMLVSWEHSIVPGLAQTEAYADAMLVGNAQRLQARLKRQDILRREAPAPPTLLFLLDETCLRKPVGSPQVMREQLEHLLVLAALPNVVVQVVPQSGEHQGNIGAFALATMEDRSEVAYMDTIVRGITTDDPSDLAVLARHLVDLRGRALPATMTLDCIRKVLEEQWI
ncbi:helix-turn-helix domain-containing protein [Actinomadura harenae]|uniref:XRE family transcriptional regulator n=1 Tax=Actinomadura harenae TaxID=2483351 RepID=A0A3M2LNP0_9ACTN|nr:helix-turn-helix transcriptional regulator [Actinomadura harenae]RMI38163.1 XRE family transcriptional regulator [Actinomadura harenae]